MEELLNMNIDNLSKEDLLKLKDKINEIIKPYNNKTAEIYNKIREIEKNEYLANRGIKNYPVLKELINEIGDTYKDVIIDIDEFLGIKRYSSIRIYGELVKFSEKHNAKITHDIIKIIESFLIEHKIITPQYEIYCSKCNNRVLVFSSNPKSDTFVKDLEKEFNDCLNIYDHNICCDNCAEETDLTDEYNIGQSNFYKIIREEN